MTRNDYGTPIEFVRLASGATAPGLRNRQGDPPDRWWRRFERRRE